jgi:alcohol dehydrogenase class IV
MKTKAQTPKDIEIKALIENIIYYPYQKKSYQKNDLKRLLKLIESRTKEDVTKEFEKKIKELKDELDILDDDINPEKNKIEKIINEVFKKHFGSLAK